MPIGVRARAPQLLVASLALLAACATPSMVLVVDDPTLLPWHRPQPLGPAEREISIWSEGGYFHPGPTLRLFERADGTVRGDYTVLAAANPLYGSDTADGKRWREARASLANDYGCRTATRQGSYLYCRAPFPRGEPDWQGLVRLLDSLEIENPPPSAPRRPMATTDSGRVTLRVCHDGRPAPSVSIVRPHVTRQYAYGGCDPLSAAQQAHADALGRVLGVVDSIAQRRR